MQRKIFYKGSLLGCGSGPQGGRKTRVSTSPSPFCSKLSEVKLKTPMQGVFQGKAELSEPGCLHLLQKAGRGANM